MFSPQKLNKAEKNSPVSRDPFSIVVTVSLFYYRCDHECMLPFWLSPQASTLEVLDERLHQRDYGMFINFG